MVVRPRNLSPARCTSSFSQPARRVPQSSLSLVPASDVKAKLLLIVSGTSAAWSALWTFPSMLASAFHEAWTAEAAQFIVSQGLALAILAWVQTLPKKTVEAVIAWEAGGDAAHCFVSSPPPGCHSHLAIANFTGAIRLLVGLAWPMIFFVAAFFGRKQRPFLAPIQLENEHAV